MEAYCHLLAGMFTEGGSEPAMARSKKFQLYIGAQRRQTGSHQLPESSGRADVVSEGSEWTVSKLEKVPD